MFRLVGLVVSIGLADSLNPSTVGPALWLAAGRHPRASVLRFAGGVYAVFFLGGALLTIGPGQALLALVPHPGPTVRYIAETVAGLAMLIGSVFLWRHRRRLRDRPASSQPRWRGHSPEWLGVTIAVVELPTALPYFAAIAAIIAAGLNVFDELFLLALYNFCFILPLLGIVVILTVARDRADEVIQNVRTWLRTRWPVVLAVGALLAGVFVTALGVTGLIGNVHGDLGQDSRHLHHLIPH